MPRMSSLIAQVRHLQIMKIAVIFTAASAFAAAPPVRLPAGFVRTVVAEHLTGATTMAIAPDGRIFICEQTGTLRVVKNGKLLEKPFLTVKVDSSWERGLLGVAFDPAFDENHFLYANYISLVPYPHHVISRFTANGDVAIEGSEKILFEGDDQSKMPGKIKNGHQGGAIHFGPDGKLYIAIGEQTSDKPAQEMNTLLGKMLRLNPDGTIPQDNPFYASATGKYRAIWCLGLRNPFCFAFQPGTGRMFINDVGGAKKRLMKEKPVRITAGRSSNMARSVTIRNSRRRFIPIPWPVLRARLFVRKIIRVFQRNIRGDISLLTICAASY